MIEGLTFDAARAREAAEGGYAAATDVADYLVGKGLPFRDAHRVAGPAGGACCAKDGRPLAGATLEELRGLSPLFDEDYYPVVDIERVVGGKVSPGGTAPERVAEQLALARRWWSGIGPPGRRLTPWLPTAARCTAPCRWPLAAFPPGAVLGARASSPARRTRWPPISSARSCGARASEAAG